MFGVHDQGPRELVLEDHLEDDVPVLEEVTRDELDALLRQAAVHWADKILGEIIANCFEIFAEPVRASLVRQSLWGKWTRHWELVGPKLVVTPGIGRVKLSPNNMMCVLQDKGLRYLRQCLHISTRAARLLDIDSHHLSGSQHYHEGSTNTRSQCINCNLKGLGAANTIVITPECQ